MPLTKNLANLKPDISVLDYIRTNIGHTIHRDHNGSGFGGFDLPHPYSSPCLSGEGQFDFFFYWDTYFTNHALLRTGHTQTAADNIRNILWLIKRQGYMPNHPGLNNRSQPPYLCRMLNAYQQASGDADLINGAMDTLLQEYNFWMSARLHPCGLNRYGQHDVWAGQEAFALMDRVASLSPQTTTKDLNKIRAIGVHHLAEAESGCDFTPRFQRRCLDHIPPELNGLLYEYERFFEANSDRFSTDYQIDWTHRAERRRELINQYCWSEARGLYLDYDMRDESHSPIASLAGIAMLAHGIPDTLQATKIVSNLGLFEREHGLAYTEPCKTFGDCQWSHPNVWPPMVYMTIQGLLRYNFQTEAERVAHTFLQTTNRLFHETGRLWEKTDSETGTVGAGEYPAAPMLGWVAGVYMALLPQEAP